MTPAADNIPLTRPSTDAAELTALAAVLESGWLAGQGPRGKDLEAGFAALTGRRHAIAVNNCTAGLHLALQALGVGPGDEVLVADYTFPATAHAVLYCGATPRFVDVRPDTGTLDPKVLEARIGPKTTGIIAVDALGMPADWDDIQRIATAHGLFLVEDAACAAGGTYKGDPCGSFGDVAVFSLHARKGITSGEGGVVVLDDDQLADQVRRASCFGMRSAFDRQSADRLEIPAFPDIGYNYKLSDLLAAVALVQLGKLADFTAERQSLAAHYAELLTSEAGATAPVVPADRVATWQTYAVTLDDDIDRDAVVLGLRNEGIGANIGTYALHREPIYAAPRDCPNSAALFSRQVALPIFPGLTSAEQDRVVRAVRKTLATHARA